MDPDAASSAVVDLLLLLGPGRLARGGRAFVNFTRNALVNGFATLLPRNSVIEVLESVVPDDEVLAACRHLKSLGYAIAVDDVVSFTDRKPLHQLADFIKVDFVLSTPEKRRDIASHLLPLGVKLPGGEGGNQSRVAGSGESGLFFVSGLLFLPSRDAVRA
jgi:EAL and modified HD-GYP domain-containing signal transduction protein